MDEINEQTYRLYVLKCDGKGYIVEEKVSDTTIDKAATVKHMLERMSLDFARWDTLGYWFEPHYQEWQE